MNTLDSAIANLALELHQDRTMALSNALAKSEDFPALESLQALGGNIPHELFYPLCQGIKLHPCSTVELAARIRSAAIVANITSARSSVELVWTGPKSGLVPMRHTEQVLKGLIDGAKERVFLVSFVAYKTEGIIRALERAAQRNVKIDLLFERAEVHGGNVTVESAKIVASRIPEACVLEWDQSVSGDFFTGASVHAKCAVADRREAFVTSANLTTAAMERNMEVGVLIKGGPVPRQLEDHLLSLIHTRHLKRINV